MVDKRPPDESSLGGIVPGVRAETTTPRRFKETNKTSNASAASPPPNKATQAQPERASSWQSTSFSTVQERKSPSFYFLFQLPTTEKLESNSPRTFLDDENVSSPNHSTGKKRNRFLQDRIFALGAHRKGIVGIQRRRVQWGKGKNTFGGNEDPFHLLYLNHNLIGLIRISNKASSEMDAKRASRVDLELGSGDCQKK